MCLALAANPRRVNDAQTPSFIIKERVNSIARSSRNRRDYDTLFAKKTVEQGRLPNIRAANDCKTKFRRLLFFFISRNFMKISDNRIQQIAQAVSLLCRDGKNFIEAEAIKLHCFIFNTRGIRLVRADKDALSSRAQQLRKLFV